MKNTYFSGYQILGGFMHMALNNEMYFVMYTEVKAMQVINCGATQVTYPLYFHSLELQVELVH